MTEYEEGDAMFALAVALSVLSLVLSVFMAVNPK